MIRLCNKIYNKFPILSCRRLERSCAKSYINARNKMLLSAGTTVLCAKEAVQYASDGRYAQAAVMGALSALWTCLAKSFHGDCSKIIKSAR